MLIQMFTYGLNIPYWKINVVVLLVCKYKLSACLKFDCLVGSNNSSNHLNSGLVPVQVSQEDVGVVRVLCVWKFIQTALWGFNHLNLATFISSSFSYLLSVIADFQSCCLHRMTFFFFHLHPPFQSSQSFHHPITSEMTLDSSVRVILSRLRTFFYVLF